MIRHVTAVLALIITIGAESVWAQKAGAFKSFTQFRQLAPGIDFFASNRQVIAPYEKPAAQIMERLRALLGENLPKGAIFICSTLAQKDSIYEPMILKLGYGWILTAQTSDVRRQEMMERIKSQTGGEVPAEVLERLKGRMSEMMADADKQAVNAIAQQIPYAILQSMLGKGIQYRSSRLDDMSKSPLPDWLDIGIASYASGINSNISYLQQHMDQTFPIEDILTMARPFVASSSSSSGRGSGGGMSQSGRGGGGEMSGGQGFPSGGFGGTGQGFPQGGFSGRTQAGSGGGTQRGGGQRGGSPRTIPKDEQDRMLFDGQSATFFSFLLEKAGMEKIRALIQVVQEGTEGREFVIQPDVLGPDFEKTEAEWANYVKAQKVPEGDGGGSFRFN
jgi:hypothetical protein